ncbi:MAG: hypothetical protein RLZZ403_632 [Pseudomonadota bacterium]|jgi:hypothetical protein
MSSLRLCILTQGGLHMPDWIKVSIVTGLMAGWIWYDGGGEAAFGFAVMVATWRWLWLERQWWKVRTGRVVA